MTWDSRLRKLKNKLFTHDKWNIGFVNQSAQSLIQHKGLNGIIKWLDEEKVDYKADPFIVNINGCTYLYYEELIFWKGKGDIMVSNGPEFAEKTKITGITPSRIHLSYPYIFVDGGNIYCLPETADAKQLSLFQVSKVQPNLFQKLRTILNGENYVDSSIIFYQGKYWLFTSLSGRNSEILIFYGNSLLDYFKPHRLNPIKLDEHCGRSAGRLFIVNGKLYRPAQNSTERYGGSVVINQITTLNENEFAHQTCFEINPPPAYNQGLHTINFADNLLVIDGKRTVFSLLTPFKKLAMKFQKLNVATPLHNG